MHQHYLFLWRHPVYVFDIFLELRLLLELQVLLPDPQQLPHRPHGDQWRVFFDSNWQLRHGLCCGRHVQQRSVLVQLRLKQLQSGESDHLLHRFGPNALLPFISAETAQTRTASRRRTRTAAHAACAIAAMPSARPTISARRQVRPDCPHSRGLTTHRAVANCQTLSSSNCALCGTCNPGYTLCAASGTCYPTGLLRCCVRCRRRYRCADAHCASRSASGTCQCLTCSSPYVACPGNNGLCTIRLLAALLLPMI